MEQIDDKKIANILMKLSGSKFRSSFKLEKQDIDYISNKGLDVIEKHTRDFIHKRLAPSNIPNDGKQTPFKGHPTFKAQHATATCCRSCLFKWHHISNNKELTQLEEDYIVEVIINWIKRQYNSKNIN